MEILVIGGSERRLFVKLGFISVGFLYLLLFFVFNFADVINSIKPQKSSCLFYYAFRKSDKLIKFTGR